MALYKEDFPVGSKVRIADLQQLQDFQRTWKYHHNLNSEQLAYGSKVAEVEKVSFYHGGEALYELSGVPGIWHEQCLASAITSRKSHELETKDAIDFAQRQLRKSREGHDRDR